MLTLITGGSKCGKSRLAEDMLTAFPGEKFYIATMQPFGDEAHAAIARHRRMRADKGFVTVEQYTDMETLYLPDGCAVLLECTGNLLANEMFGARAADPVRKIMDGYEKLAQTAAQLVIIHSEVGSDGIVYTPETMAYIRAMGDIACRTAAMADNVIECVYGIPVVRKGVLPCG